MAVHDPHLAEARRTLCRHFPAPFPGETIFSVCARFHGLSAIKRPALTGVLLLGARRASSKRCVPVGLSTLMQCLPGMFSSAQELLQQHTHAALYLRFMTQDQRVRCTNACLSSHHQRERLPFSWASSNFERQHPLRFCPRCAMADEEEHGRAYWHLNHQLPGVWVCTKHLQPLLIESSSRFNNGWALPSLSNSLLPSVVQAKSMDFFLGLSDTVARLCGSTQANLETLRNHLCLELEQAGVTQAGRALNETKLRQWLSIHLDTLGPASLDMFDAFDSQRGTDAVSGVLGKRLAQHPFRWALLIACLRLEGAQMDPIVLALHRPCQRPLPGFKNCSVSASPHMAFDAVSSGEEIRAIANQAGVSRSVVQRWLEDPEVHQVWHLARWGKTRERHLASIREALISEPPSRHALRVRASAAYQWFQKNEPAVLETLLPARMVLQLPLWS